MNEITTEVRLQTLSAEIRVIHANAVQSALMACIQIGQKLSEAKELVGHGRWGEWLESNVNYSQRQASNYMKLYEGYGTGQISLTGEQLPDSLKTMEPTKALQLLAIPEEDREAFAADVNADSISTRKLQEEIARYKAEAEEAHGVADMAKKSERAALQREEEQGKLLQSAQEMARDSIEKAENLQQRIDELEARPVEVVVQEPSEEEKNALREAGKKEAEEAAKKDRAELEQQLKQTKERMEEAERKAAEAQQKAAEEANSQALSNLKEAEAKVQELEKKLKAADAESAEIKIYAKQLQEDFNRALGVAMKAGGEREAKYRAFLKALLGEMEKRL